MPLKNDEKTSIVRFRQSGEKLFLQNRFYNLKIYWNFVINRFIFLGKELNQWFVQ